MEIILLTPCRSNLCMQRASAARVPLLHHREIIAPIIALSTLVTTPPWCNLYLGVHSPNIKGDHCVRHEKNNSRAINSIPRSFPRKHLSCGNCEILRKRDYYHDLGRINFSFTRRSGFNLCLCSISRILNFQWVVRASGKSICSVASYNQGRLGKDYFYNIVFYQAE